MVIVGISGGRTYGGHMPVLPGTDNVCVVGRMGVLEKIRNKKLFYLGRHGELPQVKFFSGDRVDIDYRARIPMQLDGELVWLEPSDFPISMEVLAPKIKVLRS
jgi:diacylglycerol kinase family enzyme